MQEKRMDTNFRKRLRRRLYYGDMADLDTPSFPLTDTAVNYFRDTVPEKLGHIDLSTASNVIRRNRVSPCSVVLSMLYAKRLRQTQNQRSKEFLQSMSSSDVFFISMMMASKYLYDEGVEEEVFSDEWADNTNQDVDDVNQMEIDFLQALDWKLFVRPHEFEETLSAIERRLALQEGLKRGWFTYSEMDVLMDTDLLWMMWTQVGSECSKLVTAISAAYVTSFLSMLGSTALAIQISGPLSSATVALLSLQTYPMSGVSFLDPLALSTPLSSNELQSQLGFKGEKENNRSDEEEILAVLNEEFDDMETSPVMRSGQIRRPTVDARGGFESTHEEQDISVNDGSHGWSSGSKEGSKDFKENGSGEFVKSSLWSLWFLDSFLAQLWAVTNIKSKISHYAGWSTGKPSPELKECGIHSDEFARNGGYSHKRSCHQKRQKHRMYKHQNPHSGKMSSLSPESNSSVSSQLGTHAMTNELPEGITPQDQVCSCQMWCGKSSGHCETTSGLPTQQNGDPTIGMHCKWNPSSPKHSRPVAHTSCQCCRGPKTRSALPDPQNPSFGHGPTSQAREKLSSKSTGIPSLDRSSELFRIPIGFVTSFYQAVQVT